MNQLIYSQLNGSLLANVCFLQYQDGQTEYSVMITNVYTGQQTGFWWITEQKAAIALANEKIGVN